MSTSLFESSKQMRRWRDELVMRLRMRNVPGAQVGDVLKTVEAHCVESGQSPQEAFGDPRAYADSLGLARPTPLRTYLLVVPAYFGALFTVNGLVGVLRGERVPFTWADFATWGLVLAGSLLIVATLGRVRTDAVALAVSVGTIVAGVMVLALLGRDAPALMQVSSWVILVGGLLMMAYVVTVLAKEIRANKIADPVTGRDMVLPDNQWGELTSLIVPVLLVVGIIVLAVLAA